MPIPFIYVVAGALFDAAGRVLIAQRPPGKHMAGGWEFPGGKLVPGEEAFAGLRRELKEELNVDVFAAEKVAECVHDYDDRRVLLDLWQVLDYAGTPQPLDQQALRWIRVEDLDHVGLLPADEPLVRALQDKLAIQRR